MQRQFITLLLAFIPFAGIAQLSVNTTGNAPHASSMFDVSSTAKGVLIPRMTEAQKQAIASPAVGLTIYQTDNTTGFWHFDGSQWRTVADNFGNHTASQAVRLNGNRITNGANNFGIKVTDSGGVVVRGKISNYGFSTGDTVMYLDDNGSLVLHSLLGIGIPMPTFDRDVMLWDAYHGAFRAGYSFDEWEFDSLGFYSAAFGASHKVKGYTGFAAGDGCFVSGSYATALGDDDTAIGNSSFSTGSDSRASGTYSIAMGYAAKSDGISSVSMGYSTKALGNYCFALGYRASSGAFTGNFTATDASSLTALTNTANNRFMTRYANGYWLYTNSNANIGVTIGASGNSWSTISDSTKKHQFIKADGDDFLMKLRELKLGSWSYEADVTRQRHYGPMAQEIFSAYGQDALGSIGNDTSLASADMDGIMMILLQALEERTANQAAEIAVLKQQNQVLKDALSVTATLKEDLETLKNQLSTIKEGLKEDGILTQIQHSGIK